MSGRPPNSFEVHRSNGVADNITARDFSDRIREWFGVEGILDMRAYLRFRCLDYFKTHLLPDELQYVSEATVSEEEIAINTMIIDFALKHKYYFTLCLLISEIQAFSKLDENVKPLLAHISSMTTDDMDSLNPLLDKEQVSRVLRAFNIDPISENGLTIHRAYQRNENRHSLIQLVLSQPKAANSEFLQKNTETEDHLGITTFVRRNDFDAIFESLTQQVTEVTRKVTNIEYKFRFLSWVPSRSGVRKQHRRRTKATKVDVKRLDMKFSYITKEVDETKNKLHILKEVLDRIRLQGKQALRHLSPYIDHLLTSMDRIGRIEMAVRRMKRRLTTQGNKSKTRTIKRRRLKMLHMTTNRFDKAVETEKRNHDDSSSVESSNQTKHGVAIQTNPVTTVDAHTQTDSHQYAIIKRTPIVSDNNNACQGKLGGDSLETPEKRKSQDEGLNTTREIKQESSVQTVLLSFRGQNTPAVLEQNYELRGKVLEQGRRINYLTMRIAQLHAGLAERKIPEQADQRRIGTTQTDGRINTVDNKMTQTTLEKQTCSGHKINDQKRAPLLDPSPLKKALWTAKAEIAALKQERQRIQECCQLND